MTDLDVKDYDGQPGDALAGRDYFKKRFIRLSAKANRINEREIYTQFVPDIHVAHHYSLLLVSPMLRTRRC